MDNKEKKEYSIRESQSLGGAISMITLEQQPTSDQLERWVSDWSLLINVGIRISYASPSVVSASCDLTFLPRILRLTRLDLCYAWNQRDFTFFESLSNLKSLCLEGLARPLSLFHLRTLGKLEELNIEKVGKDFDALASLIHLKRLVLHSIKFEDLSFLTKIPSLTDLTFTCCKILNYEGLGYSNVRKLRLWGVKETNLSFLEDIHDLEELYLHDMKAVSKLPSLKNLRRLKIVSLTEMAGLNDLSGLSEAPAVEELRVHETPKMKSDIFESLVNHPTLCRSSIRFSDAEKKNRVRAFITKNKRNFEWLP